MLEPALSKSQSGSVLPIVNFKNIVASVWKRANGMRMERRCKKVWYAAMSYRHGYYGALVQCMSWVYLVYAIRGTIGKTAARNTGSGKWYGTKGLRKGVRESLVVRFTSRGRLV